MEIVFIMLVITATGITTPIQIHRRRQRGPQQLHIQYREVPFEGVLAPGVRSGGSSLEPVKNNFVLGVIGHSHALSGLQLSIGGNMVEHDMRGVQLAPGFNLTRGPARGLQLTAGANVALNSYPSSSGRSRSRECSPRASAPAAAASSR